MKNIYVLFCLLLIAKSSLGQFKLNIIYDRITKDLSFHIHNRELYANGLGAPAGSIRLLEVINADTVEVFKSFGCTKYFYEEFPQKTVSLFIWGKNYIEGDNWCIIFAWDLEGIMELHNGDIHNYNYTSRNSSPDTSTSILKIDLYFSKNGIDSISVSDLGKKTWEGFVVKDTLKKEIITDFRILDREPSYDSIERSFIIENQNLFFKSDRDIFSTQDKTLLCRYCQLMLLFLKYFDDLYIHEIELELINTISIDIFLKNLVVNYTNCHYYTNCIHYAHERSFVNSFVYFLHDYNFYRYIKPLLSKTYKGDDIDIFKQNIAEYHKLWGEREFPWKFWAESDITILIEKIKEELEIINK